MGKPSILDSLPNNAETKQKFEWRLDARSPSGSLSSFSGAEEPHSLPSRLPSAVKEKKQYEITMGDAKVKAAEDKDKALQPELQARLDATKAYIAHLDDGIAPAFLHGTFSPGDVVAYVCAYYAGNQEDLQLLRDLSDRNIYLKLIFTQLEEYLKDTESEIMIRIAKRVKMGKLIEELQRPELPISMRIEWVKKNLQEKETLELLAKHNDPVWLKWLLDFWRAIFGGESEGEKYIIKMKQEKVQPEEKQEPIDEFSWRRMRW